MPELTPQPTDADREAAREWILRVAKNQSVHVKASMEVAFLRGRTTERARAAKVARQGGARRAEIADHTYGDAGYAQSGAAAALLEFATDLLRGPQS